MGRPLTCLLAILILVPIASSASSVTVLTSDGTAWVDCEDSWASIHNSTGVEIANDSTFTVHLAAENHTIDYSDSSRCQGVIPISEDMPDIRPIPSEMFTAIEPQVCSQDGMANPCEGQGYTGELIDDSDFDIFAINASSGQILALQLVAASAGINVDLHFQSDNEEPLGRIFELPLNTSIGETYIHYQPIDEDGRIVVSVSSPSPGTVWSIHSELYDTNTINPIDDLGNIHGIGNPPFYYNLGGDESLVITKSETSNGLEEVQLRYRYVYSSSESSWNNVTVNDRINGIDDIEYIEFQWECNCSWTSSMSHHQHFDASWERDAPGYRPISSESDNSSYPLIEMNGDVEFGELTLHMGDYQDILRVETTGWNESIHLVDVIVEGDIYEMKVTIWDMDQETWTELNEVSATYSMDKIRLSLDVGLGTHFIKIEHLNGSSAVDENAESIDWRIRVTTAVIDEGDEPWFPASEAVKDAANVFYWLIGLILILPFIAFYIFIQKEKKFAEEFASKKNRLEWLTSKLQEDDYSKNDLTRALRAVASLEWEKALEVWGDTEIRHFTTGIDVAIWSMNKEDNPINTWSLLIGVCAKECDWNVAALRFEAPEGEPWNVKGVEPKLLTRGSEIFLDSISQNSRSFIQVELEGKSDSLDIHISGIVDGEPMAAKPVRTMYRSVNQSEE
ncbi:MAG: hypothetical protein DWC02_07055 [Candidatus Poseidoniales archaeon]|nr:MAG: hypothetical protein DWC02_07055 [Candidatus Poseidoniales archaeon]